MYQIDTINGRACSLFFSFYHDICLISSLAGYHDTVVHDMSVVPCQVKASEGMRNEALVVSNSLSYFSTCTTRCKCKMYHRYPDIFLVSELSPDATSAAHQNLLSTSRINMRVCAFWYQLHVCICIRIAFYVRVCDMTHIRCSVVIWMCRAEVFHEIRSVIILWIGDDHHRFLYDKAFRA